MRLALDGALNTCDEKMRKGSKKERGREIEYKEERSSRNEKAHLVKGWAFSYKNSATTYSPAIKQYHRLSRA